VVKSGNFVFFAVTVNLHFCGTANSHRFFGTVVADRPSSDTQVGVTLRYPSSLAGPQGRGQSMMFWGGLSQGTASVGSGGGAPG